MTDNRGISPLGLCHPKYPVRELLRCFDSAAVIRSGWLDNFFNEKNSNNARLLCSQPKQKLIRVHIINGPGMNNGRTQPHEISYKETTASLSKKILAGDRRFLAKFDKRVSVIRDIVAAAPAGTLELLVSPWLEHQPIQKAVFDRLAARVLAIIPNCRIVDNPLRGSAFPGYVAETHDKNANPANWDIFDWDGVDVEATDSLSVCKRFERLKMVLGWDVRENGLDGKEGWKPPQQRASWPQQRIFTFYRYMLRPEALEVSSPLNQQDIAGLRLSDPTDGWKRDFVYKIGDGRNFGVSLLPRSFNGKNIKSITIRKNGQVIDRGKKRGNYSEDGTNRQIFDFRVHPSRLPDNCVLVADRNAWVLEKPQFRVD